MNHDIKKKGSYGVFASINIIQENNGTENEFEIPKGMKHRPICNELVKCLLIEMEGTLNQENTGGTYTA